MSLEPHALYPCHSLKPCSGTCTGYGTCSTCPPLIVIAVNAASQAADCAFITTQGKPS
jgi:hypothetical protein